MKTRIALPFAVIAVACVMGVVPMAEGVPVDQSFTLDIGTNTISGFLLTNCIGPTCDVRRLTPVRFDFVIPAHTELVGLTASFGGDWMQFRFNGAVSGEITHDPSGGGISQYWGFPCREINCIDVDLPAGPGSTHVEIDTHGLTPVALWIRTRNPTGASVGPCRPSPETRHSA